MRGTRQVFDYKLYDHVCKICQFCEVVKTADQKTILPVILFQ